MSNESIKEVIRDFVGFDIENDYYQKEKKEELVRQFKQIVYEDDATVRQFLKSFFNSTKSLAEQYSLIEGEGEAIEEPNEMSVEEPPEEPEEAEETAEESVKNFYRSTASNLLYE